MKRAALLITPVALLATGLAPAIVTTTVTAAASVTHAAAGTPGTRLWTQKFTGGTGRRGVASGMAVSPNQQVVYVTGVTSELSGRAHDNITTVAYDSATGATLWTAPYAGTTYHPIETPQVAVTPDGSTVLVGLDVHLRHPGDGWTYLVLAYNASTGALLWTSEPPGAINDQTSGNHIAVSPDSSQVFITGEPRRKGPVSYVTVALSTATGAQNWVESASFPQMRYHIPAGITVSPDGSAVYVTGLPGTVAYDAATGTELWQDHYKQRWGWRPAGIVVSPDSSTVYVAVSVQDGTHRFWRTMSYNAATGAQNWAAFYNGPGDRVYSVEGLAVTPDGSQVVITGDQLTPQGRSEWRTIGYDAATGAQNWTTTFAGNSQTNNSPITLTVTPNGAEVVVAGYIGSGSGYETVAYNVTTGAQNWAKELKGQPGFTEPVAVVASPDSSRVFVTGSNETGDVRGPAWYLTVAYSS